MDSVRSHAYRGMLCILLALAAATAPLAAQCLPDGFNQAPENQTADFGYYYAVTGGKYPTGSIPNGDNASGGTFRRIWDDPLWGVGNLNVWRPDDWFPENAGLALTMLNDGAIVYDNNGIEDGTYGDFYTWFDENDPPPPGLYRGYCMPNNYDHTYATYFKLEEDTTVDTLIGYFDGNGVDGAELVPTSAALRYRASIWSGEQTGTTGAGNPIYYPVCTGFYGDVLYTGAGAHWWEVSYTGVDRIFPPGPTYNGLTDPIWRVTFHLENPVTFPAGVYFWAHYVLLTPTLDIDVRPANADNQINTNAKQLVPIAILSTETFDAPSEVELESTEVRGSTVSPTRFDIDDVNGDGFDDLVVYVRARDLRKPTAEECADTDATILVSGFLVSGEAWAGQDSVRWLGPDCK